MGGVIAEIAYFMGLWDTRISASLLGVLIGSAINAAAVATGAIDADAIAADATAEIADAILARNLDSSGNEASTTSNGRTVRNALRILRNKVDASTGTQVDVYNEADTTEVKQKHSRRKDKEKQTRPRRNEQREADTTERKQKQSRRNRKEKQTQREAVSWFYAT
jgi:hypothetical protein